MLNYQSLNPSLALIIEIVFTYYYQLWYSATGRRFTNGIHQSVTSSRSQQFLVVVSRFQSLSATSYCCQRLPDVVSDFQSLSATSGHCRQISSCMQSPTGSVVIMKQKSHFKNVNGLLINMAVGLTYRLPQCRVSHTVKVLNLVITWLF